MTNEAEIILGLLFGSMGFGFFIYGKKQRMVVPLFCGMVLMIYPYFVSDTIVLIAVGFIFVVIPYFGVININ